MPIRTAKGKALRAVLACLLWLLAAPAIATDSVQHLLQLADYVGTDYPHAIENGRIKSASEYAEMQEFAERMVTLANTLPDSDATAQARRQAGDIRTLIAARADSARVRQAAQALRATLIDHFDVVLVPRQIPDLTAGRALYQAHCAACHGSDGRGDGPRAAALNPSPINFHDGERARQRSLLGLYNTITLGVQGTAMAAFPELDERQRWALAFYVGSLYPSSDEVQSGAAAWTGGDRPQVPLSLRQITTRTPDELADELGPIAAAETAYLRRNPQAVDRQSGAGGHIDFTLARLQDSVEAYQAGHHRQAYDLAVAAYLEGYELVEAPLRSVDADLMMRIEKGMMDYRQALRADAPPERIAGMASALAGQLQTARERLTETRLSPGVTFVSALIILAREGLEAILVLGAIAAFMMKTGRRDAMKYLHAGWVGALALGGVTWVVSEYLIEIGGSAREVTEGLTALVAAGILFYMGFWMHNKLNARRWQQFIQTRIRTALNEQALWSLAAVSFIAVYREVFETVLFYQALWLQVQPQAQPMVFAGALAAAAVLAVVAWLIFKFGLRLPLKQFFAASAAVMFVLAVVFAGKGVAALQEAGKLPTSPISFPKIDILGIYPNLQSLGLQLLLIAIAGGLVLWNLRGRRGGAR
jgi:high-affinity iron transporter